MSLTRRDAIKLGVFGSGALLLPIGRAVLAGAAERMPESRLPQPFTIPFAVPPTLAPVRSTRRRRGSGGTDFFDITMREQAVEIIPGFLTRIWGYNGSIPGPTIDVDKGTPAVVRQTNVLPAQHPTLGYRPDTSVHLHGSASLPQYDGYANDLTRPGQYKDYQYPNFQNARTLWYHDHAVHRTGENVYMGLAGMYRIHDDLERSLPIPHGRYDIPLIVSDKMFDSEGQLLFNGDEDGLFGDVILVNGRPWPVMPVEQRKYRFRILNASITRSYEWQLDSGEPMVVVGTDGGLVPTPQPVTRLRHGIAERYEVIIDFAKYPIGRRVVLQNLHPRNTEVFTNTDKVMAFDVKRKARTGSDNTIPDVLYADNPVMALEPADAVRTRTLDLIRTNGLWTLSGQTWEDVIASNFGAVIADPGVDDVELWEIRNDSGGWHHPLHIHLIDFRIIDRSIDDAAPIAPFPFELGPKDVVYTGEHERVRVMARFGPHPGRYMVHCHNLVHEDHSMMHQFEVGTGGFDPITSAPARDLPAPPL